MEQPRDGDLAVFTRVLKIGLQESSSRRSAASPRRSEPQSVTQQPTPSAPSSEPEPPHGFPSGRQTSPPTRPEQRAAGIAAGATVTNGAQVIPANPTPDPSPPVHCACSRVYMVQHIVLRLHTLACPAAPRLFRARQRLSGVCLCVAAI